MEVRSLKWGCLVLLLLLFQGRVTCQELLLHRRVPSVIQRNEEDGGEKFGTFKARSFCILTYLPVGQNQFFYALPGASLSIQSENRVVFKQNRPIALGYNSGIKWNILSLAQNIQQPLSNGTVHRSQSLQQFAVPLGLFVRWKLSNSGGRIGTFVDLGCNGFWNFSNILAQSDAPDPSVNLGARRVNSTFNRLTYVKKWGYEYEIRFGRGLWAAHVIYRANHLFKESPFVNDGIRLPDLSKWQIGIDINFWKFNKTKKDDDEI